MKVCIPESGNRRYSAPVLTVHKKANRSPRRGAFSLLALGGIAEIVLHPPLHTPPKEKPRYRIDSGVSFAVLVPVR